jgi:hypothetical protein
MKFLVSVLLCVLICSSCKKSAGTNGQPLAQDSLLSSLTDYFPLEHSGSLATYSYNQNRQLAKLSIYGHDTSGGTILVDSTIQTFAVTSSSTPPPAYDVTWFKDDFNSPTQATEHHICLYDNQKRIIMDSISISTDGGLSNQIFTYNNGNIITDWLFPDQYTPGFYSISQIDTMFLTTANMTSNIDYSAGYGFDSIGNYVIIQVDSNELNTYSYGTLANPLYQPALSNSLGATLRFNNEGDFISKNLPGKWTTYTITGPPTTLSYTWTTDAAGKVIRGVGTNTSTGDAEEIITFIYQ